MKKEQIWLVIIILILLIIIVGVTRSNSVNSEYKIGVSLPLTGPVATLGEWSLNGMKLAADTINSQGGINGKALKLAVEDDKCNAKEGANTVRTLQDVDQSDALVVYCGAVTGAVADIVDGKTLTYSISVRTEPLENKYPSLFNLSPSPDKETQTIAKYMYDQGIRKVTVLYQSDFFGQTYKDKFSSAFKSLGGQVVSDGTVGNLDTPDFRTDLQKAKSLGVQAIYTSFNPPQFSVILKQAAELGMKIGFFSAWNTESVVLTKNAGKLANGVVYTYSFSNAKQDQGDIKAKYQKEFNLPMEANAANGYDAVMLITGALKKCGKDLACMTDYSNSIKDYDGVSGKFSLKNNVADKDIYLKTVKDGLFVDLNQ